MRKFDTIDLKLLSALQDDARLTAEQLGDLCGLSPTAALKRVKKLRADKLILGDSAIVNPKALGYDTIVMALVSLERESQNVVANFKHAIKETPEIMQGYYVAGEADFLLTIVTRSIEEYEQFTQRQLYEKHPIKNIKTLVVIDPVKTTNRVPVHL